MGSGVWHIAPFRHGFEQTQSISPGMIRALVSQVSGDRSVTVNAPVYNPIAERGSDSVQSHLSRLADLGLFSHA